ncbi:MAG: hypothetical protein HOV68_20990 [Streptomycetaceae bacterium]|nr:hypothetical protein [Streptomycetaceae bacterium]
MSANDPYLPVLTVDEAARLRALALDFLARNGLEAVVEGEQLRLAGVRVMPMTNLALICRGADERDWPSLVEGHFTALLHPPQLPEDAELLRACRLRLLPDDYLPADVRQRGFRYLRPVATGLDEAIMLDAPDSVRLLGDADVARVGLDALRAAARANLVAEPVDHETEVRPDGTVIHLLGGSSMFVASKALVLAETIRATLGHEPPDDGVLLTVPGRHLLAFHLLADAHVGTAVNDLAAFALGAFGDSPGPVSPRLYWWRAGELTSITVIDDEERTVSVQPPDELMAIMRRLHGA